MKKKKKLIISIVIAVLFLIVGVLAILLILNDDTKLSSEERRWINDNLNTVQNIYVCKDINVFCNNGSGIYYDFIKDFSENYGIKVNPISVDSSNDSGINLTVSKNYSDDDILFFTDHYVILSNEKVLIKDINDLNNTKIGVLITDLEHVKKYLNNLNIEYAYYNTKEE